MEDIASDCDGVSTAATDGLEILSPPRVVGSRELAQDVDSSCFRSEVRRPIFLLLAKTPCKHLAQSRQRRVAVTTSHYLTQNISFENFERQLASLGVRASSDRSAAEWLERLKTASGTNRLSNWLSPVVLSGPYEIFDFTKGYDAGRKLRFPYGWGRYDEDRVGMYNADFFRNGDEPRTIHMGVDLGAPAGTPVFAPVAAQVHASAFRAEVGDYGGTVILKAEESPGDGLSLFMLFGHLSRASLQLTEAQTRFAAGELIGWLGEKHENGGWNSHLHLQLSWLEPVAVDLPGAVSASNRELARLIFPDPSQALQTAQAGWPASAASFGASLA